MDIANSILETIGNTPLVRLNTITKSIDAMVLAKVESFNPGNSVKDRIAVKMIADAEQKGLIVPVGPLLRGLQETQAWVWLWQQLSKGIN